MSAVEASSISTKKIKISYKIFFKNFPQSFLQIRPKTLLYSILEIGKLTITLDDQSTQPPIIYIGHVLFNHHRVKFGFGVLVYCHCLRGKSYSTGGQKKNSLR